MPVGEICGIVCPRGRRKHMNAPCLPFRHTQVNSESLHSCGTGRGSTQNCLVLGLSASFMPGRRMRTVRMHLFCLQMSIACCWSRSWALFLSHFRVEGKKPVWFEAMVVMRVPEVCWELPRAVTIRAGEHWACPFFVCQQLQMLWASCGRLTDFKCRFGNSSGRLRYWYWFLMWKILKKK